MIVTGIFDFVKVTGYYRPKRVFKKSEGCRMVQKQKCFSTNHHQCFTITKQECSSVTQKDCYIENIKECSTSYKTTTGRTCKFLYENICSPSSIQDQHENDSGYRHQDKNYAWKKYNKEMLYGKFIEEGKYTSDTNI